MPLRERELERKRYKRQKAGGAKKAPHIGFSSQISRRALFAYKAGLIKYFSPVDLRS
jgi:hypothetical protein